MTTLPSRYDCGFFSWCRFCGKGPIWSGDSGVIYAQSIGGAYYCHQDCLAAWNHEKHPPRTDDGKVDFEAWSASRPPIPRIFPVAEFRPLYEAALQDA